jgi:hypothetical protein
MAAASLLEATRLLSPPLPRPLSLRCGLRPLVRPLRLPVLRAHRRLPSPATAAKGEEHPAKSIHALSPLDALRRSVLDALAALRRPALALLLAGALLAAAGPHAALAASGGRVGGSAFSSRSAPPPSYGYTAPAPRAGTYSTAPFFSPSPFYSVGPAVGIGFGGSGFLLTLVGFAAFLYLAGFLSDSSGNGSVLTETEKTTVLKLQVHLGGHSCLFKPLTEYHPKINVTDFPDFDKYISICWFKPSPECHPNRILSDGRYCIHCL